MDDRVVPGHEGLRAYRSSDIDALADLWVRAWSKAMPSIEFLGRRPWIVAHLALPARIVVAGEHPAGFAMVWPERGELDQLAVDPVAWGTGVADALMGWAKSVCPTGLWLDVNQDNVRAAGFYRRHGFAVVSAGTNPGGTRPIWRMRYGTALEAGGGSSGTEVTLAGVGTDGTVSAGGGVAVTTGAGAEVAGATV